MLIRKFLSSKTNLCVLTLDISSIVIAWILTYIIANNFNLQVIRATPLHISELCLVLAVQLISYGLFRVYSAIWRFSSLNALIRIVKSVLLADVILIAIACLSSTYATAPRSTFAIYPLLIIAFWSVGRLLVRAYHERKTTSLPTKNVLIVGGGKAAELFIRDLKQLKNNIYRPVAILDDNAALHRRDIHNVSVVGAIRTIKSAAIKYKADMIVIAIPSVTGKKMRELLTTVEAVGLPVRMLPSLGDITSGKIAVTELRDVSLEDLLGREPINLDFSAICQNLNGQTVLITGGGGSIGSELCRQVMRFNPRKLVIVDHAEHNLYQIEDELCQNFPKMDISLYLISITDNSAIEALFFKHKPDIVYHAAAYKHVPMLENKIREAMKNNFYGTKTLAELSAKYRVKKFVMISTDKAVNPTNIMGATKRAAEIFCQNLNQHVDTQFTTVRFGNVLGSAGSVIPRFKKQLENNGPITVTHPDMTRYFMMIPEACQLVLQAGAIGQGGEIFVLDMGEPIKITYLAEQLIKLSGKIPYEDIDIVFTGLRPGEKLYEELFHENENLQKTDINKILKSSSRGVSWDHLQTIITDLPQFLEENDEQNLAIMLNALVPEYCFSKISAQTELATEYAM